MDITEKQLLRDYLKESTMEDTKGAPFAVFLSACAHLSLPHFTGNEFVQEKTSVSIQEPSTDLLAAAEYVDKRV